MTPEQAAKLRQPFQPEQIGKLPKAGITLDYVGHAATTDRLLQVDPEWTWEPMAVDQNGAPVIVSGGIWIRLTVCGVTRPGFGDGKTPKEMIGDAIRNAAMRFGVALDLWAKEDLNASSASAGTPQASPNGNGRAGKAQVEEVERLIADLNRTGKLTEPLIRDAMLKEFGTEVSAELSAGQAGELVERLTVKAAA